MKVALIHESSEFMRQFSLKYLGKHDIFLFDSRLDPWEVTESLDNSGGGLNLAIVGICNYNLSAQEYMREIGARYKHAKIVMVEPEIGSSQYVLNPSFPKGDFLCSEEEILNGLEFIL